MAHDAGASPDRVFLDANVHFLEACRETAGLLRLGQREDVELLISSYALEEACRNLEGREKRARLNRLVFYLDLRSEAPSRQLPGDVALPDKDRPILRAAITSAPDVIRESWEIVDSKFPSVIGDAQGSVPPLTRTST